jgi:hypothetical protein
MRLIRKWPSPATVIAVGALVVASAGVGAAAGGYINGSKIKPGTITGKQIKNHSVGLGKIGGTLDAGTTSTGVYSAEAAGTFVATQISFPFPVHSAPKAVVVRLGSPNPDPVHCKGSASAPKAARGYLCIYEGYGANAGAMYPSDVTGHRNTTTRFGVALEVTNTGAPGQILVENGAWAVTG